MQLSSRKQAVLKAIVKAYIETGEPVGSKNLTLLIENAPSSATLRNEMSELCELGLLHQPHTSAGRVPTEVGLRLYVDSLMHKSNPSDGEMQLIDRNLSNLHCEPEGIPAAAAKMLTELTGLPAFSYLIALNPPRIKKVDLLPISRSSAMLLLVTEDGRTRNRIFRMGKDFSLDAQNCFKKLIENRIAGRKVSELTKAYMQSVIAEAGIYFLQLMPLLTAVFEIASEIEETDLTFQGERALYNISGNETAAARILSLINRRDPIISILESIGDNVGAVFGTDTGYSELKGDTLIAAKFSLPDKYKGYIGIIGPNRMSYEHIMPDIEYTAERLTKIMTLAQKEMED